MPLSSKSRAKIFSNLTKVYRWVAFALFVRPSQVVLLFRDKNFYNHSTYYPECGRKRKSPVRAFVEQLGQILRHGKATKFYFLYGFDVKSRAEQREYVHEVPFSQRRGDLNLSLYHDYSCLLRDKMMFAIFTSGIGIRSATIVYYTVDGQLYDFGTKRRVDVSAVARRGDCRLFCKPLDGEGGGGIFIVEVKGGVLYRGGEALEPGRLLGDLTSRRYIVQEFLTQHSEMSRLHPLSINTIRLVTVRGLKDGKIHILPSILRIGVGDNEVDNTSQGGIAVGVDLATGYLKRYGFQKPKYGLKTEVHPDSGIRYTDFKIPMFDEVKRQAVYMHSLLPQIHSVGWDIAIGQEGPVFIEGNDNWEINGPQACNGGMRKEFEEYFFG